MNKSTQRPYKDRCKIGLKLRISRGYSLDNQVKDAENTTERRGKDGFNSAERRVKDGVKDAHFHGKTELQTLQEDGKRCRKPAKMARKRVKVWKDIIRAPGKTEVKGPDFTLQPILR